MLFWEKEEAKSFLTFASDLYKPGTEERWVYAVYLLALNTALRGGEIWGLKRSDISAEGKRIQVKRQFSRITLDFAPTKSKKSRLVPCNSELFSELQAIILQKKITPDETIFMNEERKPICHENFVKRKFQADLKRWQGRAIRFHDMRHTAATQLIAIGIDLKTVKEICGHADIKTTMGYAHLVDGSIDQVSLNFSISGEKEMKTN